MVSHGGADSEGKGPLGMKNGNAIAIYNIAAKHLHTAQVCVDRLRELGATLKSSARPHCDQIQRGMGHEEGARPIIRKRQLGFDDGAIVRFRYCDISAMALLRQHINRHFSVVTQSPCQNSA